MRVYLTSLGCKLNQAEIESLARELVSNGHTVVGSPRDADWAIVNTCTVTHVAARKSRQLIRQLHHANDALHIAVTGCYADRSPEQIQALNGVALVVPNAEKETLPARLTAMWVGEDGSVSQRVVGSPQTLSARTRALVKIQDGCDNRCTYCIVTIARGPQQSRAPQDVLAEVQARLAEGYQEIVLTGVNIGAYGRDSGRHQVTSPAEGWTLARLVGHLLEATDMRRLRLSSIEPWDVTDDLLALWPNQRLCRHLHLPLQSGCDATLRRMGRNYRTHDFMQIATEVRRRVPDVSLTTDVIVGFPGESDAEFAASISFVERVALARLHVFRYSPRPGTAACSFDGQVPSPAARERSQAMIALGQRMAMAFHARFVRQQVQVLFESADRMGDVALWNGLTDNYVRVSAPYPQDLSNSLAVVHCETANTRGLQGRVVCRPPEQGRKRLSVPGAGRS